MGHMQNALRGYGQVQRETASDKQIELQIFSNITSQLRAHLSEGEDRLSSALASSLTLNARLWNLLFCDLVNPDNGLPLDLKTSLISLSEFTQAHTQRVLRGEVGFSVLVDINDAVIIGLKTAMMTNKANVAGTVTAEPIKEAV